MSILVVGATGFIGKYFTKFTKFKSNIYKTSSKNKKGFIKFDIIKDNLEKILIQKNITQVIFFSAISNPKKCLKIPSKSNKINLIYPKKIFNLLLKKKIFFVCFSSEYVFDGYKKNYRESSKTNSKLLYGRQKILLEKYLIKKKFKNFTLLRIAKTYGHIITDKSIFMNFLQNIKRGKQKFKVANDQFFSALYVIDLVKIIDIILEKRINGFFNVSGNETFSRYVYFKKICNYFNYHNIKIVGETLDKLSSINNIPLNVSLKNSKLKKKINFKFTKFKDYLSIIKAKYEN